MVDTPSNAETVEPEAYELLVLALSPLAPTPRRLLAEAAEGGLPLELDGVEEGRLDDSEWTSLVMRCADAPGPGATVTVSDRLEEELAAFREDAEAGDEIPPLVHETRRLYVLELREPLEAEQAAGSEEGDEDEGQQAALVLAAWALASLTEGLVFDPQEGFFADADSFLALVMDEEAAEEGERPPVGTSS
jgi:hypothetical protein